MTVMTVDVETGTKQANGKYKLELNAREFLLGCIIQDKRATPRFFYNPEEMFQHILKVGKALEKEGEQLYVYGHNHHFDLNAYAINHIKNIELIKVIKTSGGLYGTIGENIILSDSMNFYKGKLEEIGKQVGLEKLEMPESVNNVDELKEYCLRDVQILYKFITEMKKGMKSVVGFEPRKLLTAPKTAMTGFQTHCKRTLYEKKETNGTTRKIPYSSYIWNRGTIHQCKNREFVQSAFRGATNICFQTGKFEKVTDIDINSLYPYAMKKIEFPDLLTETLIENGREIKNGKTTNNEWTNEQILEKTGVVEATLICPNTDLPYLQIRDGKLIYPRSRENKPVKITARWTTQEIKKAVQEGYELVEITKAVVWKRNLPFNPFNEYIDKLYEKKRNSTGVERVVAKMLMNSLYGKFAERRILKDRKIRHREEVEDWEQKGYEVTAEFGEDYLYEKTLGIQFPKHTNPIISILIIAQARTILYDELKKIPFQDLCYTDTDSILFTGDHLSKFKIGTELGEFKIVEKDKPAEFISEKVYSIAGKIVIAGTPNAEITQEQLEGVKTIERKRMYTINQALITGRFDLVGTFYTENIRITATPRQNQPYPPEITEYLQSQYQTTGETKT